MKIEIQPFSPPPSSVLLQEQPLSTARATELLKTWWDGAEFRAFQRDVERWCDEIEPGKRRQNVGPSLGSKTVKQRRSSTGTRTKGIAESPEVLQAYLAEHDCRVKQLKQTADGATVLVLDGCPMNPDHGQRSDTAVLWRENGIGFKCQHASCQEFGWLDVRRQIDPDYGGRERGGEGGGGGRDNRRSKSTLLVELVTAETELFHAPGAEGTEFACLTVRDRQEQEAAPNSCDGEEHREIWPITSTVFRRYLSNLFYERHGDVPCESTIRDAIAVLAAKARRGPTHRAHLRVARHETAIYIDLCDDRWRVVRVDADGWRVVSSFDCPIRLVRRGGMLALPEPVRGGSVQELRSLVNVPDDRQWALVLAWLVAALRPEGPWPPLCIHGEQGSAKSTLVDFLRDLIDPNAVPLRRPPRNERDLMISAANAWFLALDNVSWLSPEMSDCIAALSTGGGMACRELYTDDGEKIFTGGRPILINGIPELAERADFLDRSLVLDLPAISPDQRRDEQELRAEFKAVRPRILGGLLDAISAALRDLSHVRLDRLPRMADFARWAVAAEEALGLRPGSFLAAYEGNRTVVNMAVVEASPIGPALLTFLARCCGSWGGPPTELLRWLNYDEHSTREQRNQDAWPKNPSRLGVAVRRLTPSLRSAGICVDNGYRGNARWIQFTAPPHLDFQTPNDVVSPGSVGAAQTMLHAGAPGPANSTAATTAVTPSVRPVPPPHWAIHRDSGSWGPSGQQPVRGPRWVAPGVILPAEAADRVEAEWRAAQAAAEKQQNG